MANQEHLDILKQGVTTWNTWRKKQNQDFQPDFSDADFRGADLRKARLRDADLSEANLRDADLSEANLNEAILIEAILAGANLSGADLREAILFGADLSGANLSGANLSRAVLGEANFNGANLNGANLSKAEVEQTAFGDLDLRAVKGLETLVHLGPSTIGTDTIERSQGDIPEAFLRGAGLSDTSITYVRSLAQRPINYYTCFISYSSNDQDFAEHLYADLQRKGVRCWFAPEDMKIGDKIRYRIDESIRTYDKLLLVLSEHSVASTWVEHEVEMALAKERKEKRTVLFPIRLDEAILEMEYDGWPAEVRHTRHIGDFTKWKQHDDYQQALERLLRDLEAEERE
jgi:uncharacterized protein YjbI with pentapeptide repeats